MVTVPEPAGLVITVRLYEPGVKRTRVVKVAAPVAMAAAADVAVAMRPPSRQVV